MVMTTITNKQPWKQWQKEKWLPVKYRGRNDNGTDKAMNYERENNYPIEWIVTDGLKRDCIRNGSE